MSKDIEIVDEIIHYLKSNIAGHIDRENMVDVLIKYIEESVEDAALTSTDSDDGLDDMKDEIRRIISDLEDLVL